MFWKVLLHASQDEGLDLILLFPDQEEVMNLSGTIEALKMQRRPWKIVCPFQLFITI